MAHAVEICIFPISQTRMNWGAALEWLEHLHVKNPIPYLREMQHDASDAEALVMLAGRRCYMSFQPGLNPNVERVRSDYTAYIDNILKSGHGSVIEHATQSFAIEGLTRVATGELNRHRAGWAIAEGSMRYIRFEDVPFWMPDSLQNHEDDDDDLRNRKVRSQTLFHKAFMQMQENYRQFMDLWNMDEGHPNFNYKKRVTSTARRLIGMGVSTGGIWTGNLRAVRHVLDLRCDDQAAEEEIFHIFRMIGDQMVFKEERLFGDFTKDPKSGAWNAGYKKV